MLPPEPDVIAYDENMDVLFMWTSAPNASSLDDLPKNGLAGMAIRQAHLIRRRDGLVLKGQAPDTEILDEIVLPEETRKPEPARLKRVDLIPPPEELLEHAPLTNDQLVKVALHAILLTEDGREMVIDDRDIVRALNGGQISIERIEGEGVVLRAHLGCLDVISINAEAPKKTAAKRARKSSEGSGSNGS